ncbi:MAG: ParB/RepB/Spo0J family partition protein [Mariprofundaceae bacterium]|nr:ParB/RepB/Spo0J family partition protein [Mariprofundaceae bacterium]
MAIKKRGLGRGLNALLAGTGTLDPEISKTTNTLKIKSIKPNPFQPRVIFDDAELTNLAESIRLDGVIMPILVRPAKNNTYQLIAGERRWRASQLAGLHDIPAIVRDVDDRQALELAIIENEHRNDLTAMESARAYQRLHKEFGLTQIDIATRIGISRSQVTNLIRLLQLPQLVQDLIDQRAIGMGHARPLINLSEAESIKLAQRCIAEGWSVRQVEQASKNNKIAANTTKTPEPSMRKIQDEISLHLGLAIQLNQKRNGKGEMRIKFKNQQEMDDVIHHIKKLRTA